MPPNLSEAVPQSALLIALPPDAPVALRTLAARCSAGLLEQPESADWRAGLALLRKANPQRALLWLRRADLWLADDAIARIAKAAEATVGPVTSLSNASVELTPAAPDCVLEGGDPAALDAAVHMLGARAVYALESSDPPWVALGADADPRGELSVADHIYVHLPGAAVRGLSTPADRRERAPAHPLARLRRVLLRAGAQPAAQWTAAARDQRPVILHILHGWGGGAERFVRDLASADSARHHLLLRARGNPSRRRHGEFLELCAAGGGPPLRRLLLTPAIGAISERHASYQQALSTLLADFAIEQIWVSSLIGHSLDALRCGLPIVWIAHDYFPFWPTLHRDFGAATARFDERELAADLASVHAGPFAELDPLWWRAIHQSTAEALHAAAAQIVAPSRSTLENLLRVCPELAALPQHCIAHGSAGWPEVAHAAPPGTDEFSGKLRVVVLGRINGGKGLDLLQRLLPRLSDYCDVYLIGPGKAAERLFGHSGVHILLDYAHAQLPAIMARIAPHAALLPATVSETFSYTLSELWRLGIPPIATQLGAFAERIVDGQTGILVPAESEAILERIAALDRDRAPLRHIRQELSRRAPRTLQQMLNDYAALLPQGERPALRYSVLRGGPQQLAEALLADALTDHELRLEAASTRLAEQDAELARRAEWGFDLHQQLTERTRWAMDLDQELGRTRQWMNERESVYQRTVAEADSRRLALEGSLTQLQAELRKTMDEAQNLKHTLDARIETLTDALADRVREIVALSAENRQLAQERADLNAQCSALEAEHISLRQQREAMQYERDSVRRELAAVTAARAELLASTSWRLTAPLRGLVQFVKRARASLRFRSARFAGLLSRLRGSLARRGLRATLVRLRRELRDTQAQPPVPIQVETPQPAVIYEAFSVPTSAAPLVSIVVPVYNQLHHTWNCLKALEETAADIAFEIIVVDDGSSDSTAIDVPRVAGVRFHKNAENLGFIGACNAGAALARGKYLFFLNNDTAVQAGWLAPLVESFSRFDRVGLVGSKLIYPDGRLQEAGGIVFSDGSGWNYGRFDHPDDPRYSYPREVDYCSGAAILIEKALFERFGGFDSLYKPAYYEDTDLAFKVREAGLRVIYQPASKVVHFEGITSGTDTSTGTKRFQVINQAKFLERWKEALLRQPAPTDHAGIWRAATHRARGRILLIDATTPTPDQDSGSVRYINLIRVLTALGWQCTFFADNRAYIERYTDELQALGVEVQFHPWLADPVAFFRDRGPQFDAVMLSRHYVATPYVDLVREHAPHALLLFDTVDLHYLREQRAAVVAESEALARQAETTRLSELDLIRRCDVTLVVSPVEQQMLAHELPGQRVEVLSNIHEVAGRRADFHSRKDIWFVGGFQHHPNVDAVLWFATAIWPRVHQALPDLRFHVVGSKITAEVEALAGNGIEVHGFVENIEPYLDGCRLAVAPLRYGAGVKGKVNQSMAYGQPVVATPMAVEGMEIVAGSEALVAELADDFADAIVRLYQDPRLWLRLSDAGLANIRAHFSFEAASAALQRILERR